MATVGAPSTRKVWTYFKVWSAVRDLPELGLLAGLIGGALSIGAYTVHRSYFGNQADTIPSIEQRHDWRKQCHRGQEIHYPSIFERVGQNKIDPVNGLDVAVWPFSNRAYPHEYDTVYRHKQAHPGVAAEGPTPTEW